MSSVYCQLNLLHFNDVYNIEEQNVEPKGGAARFYTAIEQFRNNDSLLLFSGDGLSPSMLSNVTQGKHMIEVLNKFKIDCAILGNHDLDFGVDNFIECMELCSFPWLNSNCIDQFTSKPLGNCREWIVIEKAGLKIGLIGMIESEWVATLSTVDADDVTVLDFIETANHLSQFLKKKQNCDIVICLTHMRWPNDYLLGEQAKGIDLILGGHDHNYGVEKRGECYIVKSGTDFREFSQITIEFDKKEGKVKSTKVEKTEVTSVFKPNEQLQEMVECFIKDQESKMAQVIGTLEVDLDARFESIRLKETNVGNFIADIMLTAVEADCALFNSGSLRSDKIIPAGKFTLKELNLLLPIIDPIIVIEITGAILLAALENGVSQVPKLEGRFPQVSGITFQFSVSKPSGSRIDQSTLFIQDQIIDLKKKYRLAIKGYIGQGKDGYNMFTECPILLDEENGPGLNTAVQNYFQTIKVLSGFKTLRVAHYQKLLDKRKRHNLAKCHSHDSKSRWHVVKDFFLEMEKELCHISPKVEGRIVQLD